ncbi:MAG: SMC-Scp complex subunit ScpB [Gammaproteobacteria bacterium]|nr:MAG: SMC-Scp complex subunit ScpB [Gammaproteobacteria bacterium]
METDRIRDILEAVLMAAGKPLSIEQLEAVFEGEEVRPPRNLLREALEQLERDYAERPLELRRVASGWRFQIRADYAPWVQRLWEEKPPRYSRALLETLALIAYRQPITRGEIEEIRGVSVSSHIIKTLQEREWVRVVGHLEVPGRPALYGTTRQFLDYFNLRSLDDLPTLAELRDLDALHPELNLPDPDQMTEDGAAAETTAEAREADAQDEVVPSEATARDEPAEASGDAEGQTLH